jgi:hypothetical protein
MMRRKYLIAAIAAAVLLAVIPAVAEARTKSGGGTGPTGGDGLPPVLGKFSSVCFYDHTAPDDPLIFPNQPGASHSHDFISNNTTDARSTTASLLAGKSNCFNSLDTAAYWVPTLYKSGTAVHPSGITVYYLVAVDQKVTPYPPGFKEIAGNPHAMSAAQAAHIFWGCSTTFPTLPQAPTCKAGEGLHVRIDFADCWDGRNLDSPNHVSHVAYSVNGSCPSGYPVLVPALSVLVKYPTNDGKLVTLSSGGTYSMHADFFNAWNEDQLTLLVDKCLNKHVKCARPTPGG